LIIQKLFDLSDEEGLKIFSEIVDKQKLGNQE